MPAISSTLNCGCKMCNGGNWCKIGNHTSMIVLSKTPKRNNTDLYAYLILREAILYFILPIIVPFMKSTLLFM